MKKIKKILNIRRLYKKSLKVKLMLLVVVSSIILPSTLIALLASAYYYLGIEDLFDKEINHSVKQTVHVAQLYLDEHIKTIKTDILNTASQIESDLFNIITNHHYGSNVLNYIAEAFNLSEIIVFNREQPLARTSWILVFPICPQNSLNVADKGEIYVWGGDSSDKVQAILKLKNNYQVLPTYLMIGRYIDTEIIKHLQRTKSSASLYDHAILHLGEVKKNLISLFMIILVSLLIITLIITNRFCSFIINPLLSLAEATKKIKDGNYIPPTEDVYTEDEIGNLALAFKSMSINIVKYQNDLIFANRSLEQRRQFIETVLSEMSSGILVIDKDGIVTLANNMAQKILEFKDEDEKYYEYFPEIKPLVSQIHKGDTQETLSGRLPITQYISLNRSGKIKSIEVKLCVLLNIDDTIDIFIVTLQDITEINMAQKLKANDEMIKRIAHEIKNPLTPIQLAVEYIRILIKDKLEKSIDDKVQNNMDIIISKILETKKMLMQFLSARPIKPTIGEHDISMLCRNIIELEKRANQFITYQLVIDNPEHIIVKCDSGQIEQVLMNLLQNSAYAIQLAREEDPLKSNSKEEDQYFIKIEIKKNIDEAIIQIIDNGIGLYYDEKIKNKESKSIKKHGFGLGLSIVRAIVNEHMGSFTITNNTNNAGAIAIFTLKCK